MALARAFTGYATTASALVAALVSLRGDRRGVSGWIRATSAGACSGLRGGALAVALERAETTGLIESRTKGRETFIRPGPMAPSIFGLGLAKAPRRAVDPAAIGDHPSAPVVAELASDPSAFPSVEALADRLGIDDPGEVWAVLESAAHAGLVDLWPDHPAGPSAMLSAETADRLGLELSADLSRWIAKGDHDPTTAEPAMGIVTETDASPPDGHARRFDEIHDPKSPGGLDVMAGYEDDARRADDWAEDGEADPGPIAPRWHSYVDQRQHCRLPGPRLILGLGVAWPVMAEGVAPARHWTPSDGPCPVCSGRRITFGGFCLLCHRSGMDRLLPIDPPAPPDPEPEPAPAKKRRKSRGGSGHVAYRKGRSSR